ncbi:MAG TPA: TonB-dependent receptor [Kofleriaceae bacterium]|nr:TonB-dependent receptor [Kofleriaceae bacterium]
MRVHGRVVDALGKPVRGAQISVEGSAVTTTSDGHGRFAIDAAPGASLVVLRDGYAAGLAIAADHLDDVVLLTESAASETIEIHDEPPPAAQGAARLSREQLERMPGTGNDLVRTLSAMPGVASYPLPLGQAGVVIRGSSPQDSKILVDDFEVPSLYHDIGFKSVIPTEAIDTLEYVPGGFDVAFGRAASGIVNVTTREGSERTAQQAELSAGEASVLAQGSGKRGRYLLAVRRSTIDFLLPALLPDDLDLALTTVPRFYDEQFRFDYKLTPKWNLRVSSLGSDDALELYASRDQYADKRFYNRTRFVRLTTAARYHDGPWSATLALSGIAQQFQFERGLYQHLDVTAPALTGRAELMRTASQAAGLSEVAWRVGGEVVTTRYSLDLALPADRREGEPSQPDDPMDTSLSYTGDVTTQNAAAWTALAASLDEHVRFTAGLRVDRYGRAHDVAVQPRAELAITIRPKLVARLSAGAYSRPPEHQSELLADNLAAERSTQTIAGLLYEPAEGVRLQSSLYYTDRSRLIVRDEMTGGLTNAGRGTTMGAELLGTVSRGGWFGWLAYSYSHSTRVDAPGEERRLFDYDQPHNLNVAGSYRFGKWQLGARFRLSSGMPMTPVEAALFDSDANVYYPAYGVANSERAPIHHQLDLRVDKFWRWGPVKMSKFLDVQNVYMNDSVVGYFYGFDYQQRGAFRSLPILPTAGVRGEF